MSSFFFTRRGIAVVTPLPRPATVHTEAIVSVEAGGNPILDHDHKARDVDGSHRSFVGASFRRDVDEGDDESSLYNDRRNPTTATQVHPLSGTVVSLPSTIRSTSSTVTEMCRYVWPYVYLAFSGDVIIVHAITGYLLVCQKMDSAAKRRLSRATSESILLSRQRSQLAEG
eukprot:gene34625-46472_t